MARAKTGTAKAATTAAGSGLDRALLSTAAGTLVALVLAAALRRIWEVDFWWQYKAGELIATRGIPHVDPWSYVSRGRPWLEMRWLYCDIVYRTVQLVGFGGATALKALVMLATFTFTALAARVQRAPAVAAATLAAAMLCSTQRFFVRPEMTSFLLFAAFLWIIAAFRERGGRILWLLPALQLLWSNLHTQFLLGPALVGLLCLVEALRLPAARRAGGAAWTAARRRTLTAAGVLAATAVACLVTPYGLDGVGFGLRLLREINDPVYKALSDELKGPFAFGVRYTAVLWFEVLLGLCAAAALAAWRRLDPYWSLLLLSQLWLALTSIRNLPLFALAAIPFVVHGAAVTTLPRPAFARRALFAGTIVLCAVSVHAMATDRFNVGQGDSNQFGAGIATHRYPEGAARFLREKKVPGPLFHTMFTGSYLVAQGFESFIDPRLEVHGDEFLAFYDRMTRDEAAWREAEARWHFQSALVELGSPLLARLTPAAGWSVAYFDDVAAVFVRDGAKGAPPPLAGDAAFAAAAASARAALPAPPDHAAAGLFGRVVSPTPYLRLARFLQSAGQSDLAEPFARDALRAWPDAPGVHGIVAQGLEKRGQYAAALAEYEAELAQSPGNQFARRQAGILAFRAGRAERALTLLTASVREVDNDPLPWAVLMKLHADAGRTGEAVRCAERAAALAPDNVDYVAGLGRLQGVSGNAAGAIETLRRALAMRPGDALLRGDYAAFLADAGRRDEALAEIARALAAAPGNPQLLKIEAGLRAGSAHRVQ